MIFNRICMAFFSVKLNSFCWWKIKLHMGWSQNRVYSNNHSNRENHRQPEDWVVPDFQTNPSIVWYFLQLFWANMWQGKRFNTTQKKRFNRVAPLFRPKKWDEDPWRPCLADGRRGSCAAKYLRSAGSRPPLGLGVEGKRVPSRDCAEFMCKSTKLCLFVYKWVLAL